MIYADDELRRWWGNKSQFEREALFAYIEERAEGEMWDFIASLRKHWDQGKPFSPKQLNALRKWDRG